MEIVLQTGNDRLFDLKILYVEDDESIRDGLSKFLSRRTSQLITASNGVEGYDKFCEYSPDIIITDIRMPVMSGLDMVEKVRKISQDVPIIITTAHNEEEFYQRAIDLCVDKYIKKPVDLRELINIISRAGRVVIQQRELESQARLINNILDVSRNFMIIIDGRSILYANRSILNFAGCGNIEELRSKYPDLSGLLVSSRGACSEGREFFKRIEQSASQQGDECVVYMKPNGNANAEVRAFLVQVNKFPETSDVLLSFSDVTNIEREKTHYQEVAQYDELTRIYNRKKFNAELLKEIDRVIRYRQHLSLAIFDVDHFKYVNDSFGHLMGDYVLKEIVSVVNAGIRKCDIFSRYGGEEFTLLMPETPIKFAADTVERIRKAIETHVFGEVDKVTCSFGVTEYRLEDTSESFVSRADRSLYKAKESGRNRVEVAL